MDKSLMRSKLSDESTIKTSRPRLSLHYFPTLRVTSTDTTKMISRALIFTYLVLGLAALSCLKLDDKTNPFNVEAKGRIASFSFRTTGTGTRKQKIGEFTLMNAEEQFLLGMTLTVELGTGDKVFLLVAIEDWTYCKDEDALGSQCSLTSTPSDVHPAKDDCYFSFTPSATGMQTLEFEEEGDFLVLSVNKEKVGKVARPELLACGFGFVEQIKKITGSGSLYSCD